MIRRDSVTYGKAFGIDLWSNHILIIYWKCLFYCVPQGFASRNGRWDEREKLQEHRERAIDTAAVQGGLGLGPEGCLRGQDRNRNLHAQTRPREVNGKSLHKHVFFSKKRFFLLLFFSSLPSREWSWKFPFGNLAFFNLFYLFLLGWKKEKRKKGKKLEKVKSLRNTTGKSFEVLISFSRWLGRIFEFSVIKYLTKYWHDTLLLHYQV